MARHPWEEANFLLPRSWPGTLPPMFRPCVLTLCLFFVASIALASTPGERITAQEDVKMLTLESGDGGDGRGSDWGLWLDPQLLR